MYPRISCRACHPTSTRLVSLLFALLSVISRVQSFETNLLYRYELSGSVAALLPDYGLAKYSGYAVHSLLAVRRTSNDTLVLQLDNPRLGYFNEVVENLRTFKAIERVQTFANSSALERPFEVRFSDSGSIFSFEAYSDEPVWATNFKRGILGFFQLKLSNQSTEYVSMEDTIHGICDVQYRLTKRLDEGTFNVTKQHDGPACRKPPKHRYMSLDSSYPANQIDTKGGLGDFNASQTFELTGSSSGYVISRSEREEKLQISPLSSPTSPNIIETFYRLHLFGKVPADSKDKIFPPRSIRKVYCLSFSPGDDVASRVVFEGDFIGQVYLGRHIDSSETIEKIAIELLDEFVTEREKYLSSFEDLLKSAANEESLGRQDGNRRQMEDTRLGLQFTRLRSIMGVMAATAIERFHEAASARGEKHRRAFWEVAYISATGPTMTFFLEAALKSDSTVEIELVRGFLAQFSLHNKFADASSFDDIIELCMVERVRVDQVANRMCILALASIVHEHCVKRHVTKLYESTRKDIRGSTPKGCSSISEYHQRLADIIASNRIRFFLNKDGEVSMGEKMFNVTLAGEITGRSSVKYLLDLIYRTDEHPALRAAAVRNLKKATRIYPDLLEANIKPLFFDREQSTEIRAGAFEHWFRIGLQDRDVDEIVKELQISPRRLFTYVHTWIRSHDRRAHRLLERIEGLSSPYAKLQLNDSMASLIVNGTQRNRYGSYSRISVVYSDAKDTLLPSRMSLQSITIMSGVKFEELRLDLIIHGLDEPLRKILRMCRKADLFKILTDRNSSGSLFSSDQLNGLKRQDFIDSYIELTTRQYGKVTSLLSLDSSDLQEMVTEKGTLNLPFIWNILERIRNQTFHRTTINFEVLEIYSNAVGLPILHMTDDFQFNVASFADADIGAKPTETESRRRRSPKSADQLIRVILQSCLGQHREHIIRAGPLFPPRSQFAGVGFSRKENSRLPISLTLDVDVTQKRIELKTKPIQQDLLFVSQSPTIFLETLSSSSNGSFAQDTSFWETNLSGWIEADANKCGGAPSLEFFLVERLTSLGVGILVEGQRRIGYQQAGNSSLETYVNPGFIPGLGPLYKLPLSNIPMEFRMSTSTTTLNASPIKNLTLTISVTDSGHKNDDGESARFNCHENLKQYKIELQGGANNDRYMKVGFELCQNPIGITARLYPTEIQIQHSQLDLNQSPTSMCYMGSLESVKEMLLGGRLEQQECPSSFMPMKAH